MKAQKKTHTAGLQAAVEEMNTNKVSTTEAHAYGFLFVFIALPTRPDLSLRQTNLSHNFKFLPAAPKNKCWRSPNRAGRAGFMAFSSN